jgi:hypothetical protein
MPWAHSDSFRANEHPLGGCCFGHYFQAFAERRPGRSITQPAQLTARGESLAAGPISSARPQAADQGLGEWRGDGLVEEFHVGLDGGAGGVGAGVE